MDVKSQVKAHLCSRLALWVPIYRKRTCRAAEAANLGGMGDTLMPKHLKEDGAAAPPPSLGCATGPLLKLCLRH